jgi:cobalt/nickel transport protein
MNRWLVAGGFLVGGLVLLSFLTAGSWGGTDAAAVETVESVDPGYEPWFRSLWTPPSGEVESLLFSLQAAIGGLVIGYYIGRRPSSERGPEEPQ